MQDRVERMRRRLYESRAALQSSRLSDREIRRLTSRHLHPASVNNGPTGSHEHSILHTSAACRPSRLQLHWAERQPAAQYVRRRTDLFDTDTVCRSTGPADSLQPASASARRPAVARNKQQSPEGWFAGEATYDRRIRY